MLVYVDKTAAFTIMSASHDSAQSCKRHRMDIMDEYLASIGFKRKPTPKDGSCLFRAVAEQVYFYIFLNCILILRVPFGSNIYKCFSSCSTPRLIMSMSVKHASVI